MKAIVVEKPGGPDVLQIREVPDPRAKTGYVLIRVRAFGLNRSEMFTRQGHSPSVLFPRILGIECVGEVVEAPGSDLKPGQQVAAIMGGMGREFDGGYAEMACVPRSSVFPFKSNLDWATLGAVPELFQTANGSLTSGLALGSGQRLLIRGGTSSVGMMAAGLAKRMGAQVASTTRSRDKVSKLESLGVDYVLIDDGAISKSIQSVFPGGADCVLELIGTETLIDSMRSCRPGGIVCMAGILGNSWTFEKFTPMEDIPHTVRLTSYSGSSTDLAASDLQNFLDDLETGKAKIYIDRVFAFNQIVEAHTRMEENKAAGKMVVLVDQ